jgi:hypothetical protein
VISQLAPTGHKKLIAPVKAEEKQKKKLSTVAGLEQQSVSLFYNCQHFASSLSDCLNDRAGILFPKGKVLFTES